MPAPRAAPPAGEAAAHALARSSGSSFYLSFLALPRARREAILDLYAWCRRADDIVDADRPAGERRARLAAFRADLERAFAGEAQAIEDPVARALPHLLARFPIPRPLFLELLAGVEMDLDVSRYARFEELRLYAYRVASVVGLMSIEVFGYRDPRARDYAVHLGLALQLTNILRDVAQDLARGRVYLPLEDLARHGASEADLVARRGGPALRAAAAETARRAREEFARARASFPEGDRRSLFPAEAMGAIYRRLLDRIERGGFDLFGPRARVGRATKAWLVGRELLRARGLFPRGAGGAT